MTIDLRELRARHPLMNETTAANHVQRAALALQRHHRPGVALTFRNRVGSTETQESVVWSEYPESDRITIDTRRTTEDGADTVALVLLHVRFGWTVLRRLDVGDYADWLLADPTTGDRIALEVAGTDGGADGALLRKELEQVRQSALSDRRYACVVRFKNPRCTLEEGKVADSDEH